MRMERNGLRTRTSALLLLATICIAVAAARSVATDSDQVRNLGLKDLMGEAWPEFSAELNTVIADPRNEDSFDRMYRLAKRWDAEFKVPQYVQLLSSKQPDNPQLRVVLGLFYKELRDYKQALLQFRAAMEKAPDDYYPAYQAAWLLGKQEGEPAFKEAAQLYEKAAGLTGAANVDHKTRILQEWGELIVSRSGSGEEAVKKARASASSIWDRMIAEERQFDRITYDRLAAIYERYEMWDKAREVYRTCIEKVVKDDAVSRVTALDAVGRLSENMRDYAGANAAFTEALGLVDENHWLHKQLIVKLLRNNERLEKGPAFVAQLEKTSADRKESLAALRDWALAEEKSGNLNKAIQVLEQAHALAPADIPATSELILLWSRAADPNSAAKRAVLFKNLIETMPENFEAYVGLAEMCVAMKQPDQAREALRMLENSASKSPLKFLVMARAFRKFGMKQGARQAFERTLEADPQNIDASMELCDFCLQSGDEESVKRAIEIRDSLIGSTRLDETGYLRLMQILLDRQRSNEALEVIGHGAANVFPQSFILRQALADLHYSRKEFQKAIQQYVFALSRAPNFYFKRQVNDRLVTLMFNYGRRVKNFWEDATEDEIKKGQLGGAKGEGLAPWIYYLQLAVSTHPNDSDSMMLLAQINETMQVDAKIEDTPIKTEIGRARTLYKSVVDMDLKNLDAHAALARTALAIDEFEESVRSYWILEELSPVGKWQYRMTIGDIFYLAGDKERSLQNWNQVKSQAASEPNLIYQLGARMFMAGKRDDAADLIARAVESNRKDLRPFIIQGNLLDQANAYAAAIEAYQSAVELAGQEGGSSLFLTPVIGKLLNVQLAQARSLWVAGKFEEARTSYAAALETAKKLKERKADAAKFEPDIEFQTARCLLELGKHEDALKAMSVLAEANPEAEFRVEDALQVRGKYLKALIANRTFLKKAEAAKPAVGVVHLALQGQRNLPGMLRWQQPGNGGAFWIGLDAGYYKVDGVAASGLRASPEADGSARVVMLDGDHLILQTLGGLTLLDLAQGKALWKLDGAEFANAAVRPCGQNLAVFVNIPPAQTAASGKPPATPKPGSFLRWIERASGKEIWQAEYEPGKVRLGNDGVALMTGRELIGIDPVTGKPRWRVAVNKQALWREPVNVGGAWLLVDDVSRTLEAYDAVSGELRYRRKLEAPLCFDPLETGGGDALLYTSQNGGVVALSLEAATGRVRWQCPLAEAGETLKRLQGLGMAPLRLQNVLLHLDVARGVVWPLDVTSGRALAPVNLPAEAVTALGRNVAAWAQQGDAICLVEPWGRTVVLKASWVKP